jgi:hypothetical protein
MPNTNTWVNSDIAAIQQQAPTPRRSRVNAMLVKTLWGLDMAHPFRRNDDSASAVGEGLRFNRRETAHA